MPFKKLLSCAAVFALLFGLTVGAYAQAPPDKPAAEKNMKPYRVLFAVTSPETADWNLTMGNIRNLIKDLPNAEVEVVAYGPGVSMVVKPSPVDEAIQGLIAQHVRFVACENAMRARHVTAADLLTGVGTVPAGIVEVVTKEAEGWVYVHAGR